MTKLWPRPVRVRSNCSAEKPVRPVSLIGIRWPDSVRVKFTR